MTTLFSFLGALPLPFVVVFSLELAAEVKVDMYEIVVVVLVVVVPVVVVVVVVVVETGILEVSVPCCDEIIVVVGVEVEVHIDVDVDVDVVVTFMRRTVMPRRETRKRTSKICIPIWIRLHFKQLYSSSNLDLYFKKILKFIFLFRLGLASILGLAHTP